jgi:hypothetical protein
MVFIKGKIRYQVGDLIKIGRFFGINLIGTVAALAISNWTKWPGNSSM